MANIFAHSIAVMGMIIQGTAGCPPNGNYQLTIYSWPVTSSIIGPVEEASESGPLRVTLPMEVVMVSMYVTPVASSLMMQLVLIVEILGVTISPMGAVPMGV